MADFEKTGTGNWTSSCGADFSFSDKYIHEKANLGYVRRFMAFEYSGQVMDAYDYIQSASELEADGMLMEIQQEAEQANDAVFEAENVNPSDGIPAYVESQLCEVPESLPEAEESVVEEHRRFYLSELYDAVRKDGLNTYLSEQAMNVLNSDDYPFCEYDARMSCQEIAEAEAESRSKQKKTDLSYHRDYAKGFEMDEQGNCVDDGYSIG